MSIPENYKVDFSTYRKDLIVQAIERMLGQHYDKCALKQFVLAVMGEVQCLYDALVDLQEMRTLYRADGENLDALGRIVGEPRAPYKYDEAHWMFADRVDQGVDAVPAWSLYGPFAVFLPAEDDDYKPNILARIAKNHALTASITEIERLTHMITGYYASFDKTGPMQVDVLVPGDISPTAWNLITSARSDSRVDDMFMIPYPATLWFSRLIFLPPERGAEKQWFCADADDERRCDRGPCPVGITLSVPESGGQSSREEWFCADRDNWQRCDRGRCALSLAFAQPGAGDDNIVLPEPGDTGGVTLFVPENWLCADRINTQRPDRASCAAGVPIH